MWQVIKNDLEEIQKNKKICVISIRNLMNKRPENWIQLREACVDVQHSHPEKLT